MSEKRTIRLTSELDALPIGTVVLDASAPPSAYQKDRHGVWMSAMPYVHGKTSGVLAKGAHGVTVLHEPANAGPDDAH